MNCLEGWILFEAVQLCTIPQSHARAEYGEYMTTYVLTLILQQNGQPDDSESVMTASSFSASPPMPISIMPRWCSLLEASHQD